MGLRGYTNDWLFCTDKMFARTKGDQRRTQSKNSCSASREDQGRKVSLGKSKGHAGAWRDSFDPFGFQRLSRFWNPLRNHGQNKRGKINP